MLKFDKEPDGTIVGLAIRHWRMHPEHGSLLVKLELRERDPAQESGHRSLQIGLTEFQVMAMIEHLKSALAILQTQRPHGTA